MTPHIINPNEIKLGSIMKTLKYFVKQKLSIFIIGIILILAYSLIFPFITSNLCVGLYDENEGLALDETVVSTYFSRYLEEKG